MHAKERDEWRARKGREMGKIEQSGMESGGEREGEEDREGLEEEKEVRE